MLRFDVEPGSLPKPDQKVRSTTEQKIYDRVTCDLASRGSLKEGHHVVSDCIMFLKSFPSCRDTDNDRVEVGSRRPVTIDMQSNNMSFLPLQQRINQWPYDSLELFIIVEVFLARKIEFNR
ncbi:hypothetical protein SAMN05421837_103755 [Amycolatopsis pretoriensis]|uniref:Uncharacterized protein n=1 Tax=Amycolatopsis pretoriensis TaxID=218821 RepID=A0A1H5QPR7_9PSEU|nr:hypothetical protein SAMN05421837_103755 [Amycolatopsis pretoriensis]